MTWVPVVTEHRGVTNGVSDLLWDNQIPCCCETGVIVVFQKQLRSHEAEWDFQELIPTCIPWLFLPPLLQRCSLHPEEPTPLCWGPHPSSLPLGTLLGYCLIPTTLHPVLGTWHILISDPSFSGEASQRHETISPKLILFPSRHSLSFLGPDTPPTPQSVSTFPIILL